LDKIAWNPTEDQVKSSRIYSFMKKRGFETYDQLYKKTVQDPAWFWEVFVEDLNLEWYQLYHKVLEIPSSGWKWAKWFTGGKMNLVRNALDRHVFSSKRNQLALIWEGEEGKKEKFSYFDLYKEVCRTANGLKSLGIKKGDRVGIFMPMTPECVISTLAVSKIGAIFVPLFSGYGSQAIAARLNDCEAKLLFTSDGFYRRGKLVLMKPIADEAIALSPSVKHCIVHRRTGEKILWSKDRDLDWREFLNQFPAACVTEIMDSEDPYMIIYTSGTTGKPKGTVHTHCGFPFKAAMDLAYHFDLKPEDLLFWFSDMGWMMGPWEVAGALTLGSTFFIYDGAPDYPDPDRLWRMIETHGITMLGLSPTVIRAFMKYPAAWVEKRDLSSLRVLGSTGEPWNPEAWNWYFEKVGKRKAPIINYSGGTEISGGILACSFLQPLKPCSFAGPTLGMDADVVNERGESVKGEVGELVIRAPWVGMTRGFWKDPERYEKTYWSRIPGIWFHGDWVKIDEDGFWFIEGRSDDTIKVAGKRIGPAEVESAFTSHPSVSEAAAIGIPDELKGEAIVCFVVLKPGIIPDESLRSELRKAGGNSLGKAVAPQMVKFVKEIPKTRNGKVMRRVIRAKYLGLTDLGDLSGLESLTALEAIEKSF
jgi:acetyl-CoA synthetase